MLASLVLLALASSPPASPLEESPKARASTPGVGRVLGVTGARAYLDAGEEAGLAVGQVLTLRRGEGEAGRCTVEEVAPSHATCTGGAARSGDTFLVGAQKAPREAKAVELPPPLSDGETARRAAAVATAPIVQVVDKVSAPPPAAPALARAALGEVDLEGAYWNTNPGGPWELAAVDAAVHGAPLGPLLVDVDLRAEHYLKRTNPVFRPEDPNQFYLWQAQAGWYPADRRITLDAGRVIPWSIPLATVMDGAVVGWRGDGYELRGFGGLVPEPDTTAPTTTRATGGAAWVIEDRPSDDLVLRQEGRLAWSRSPELGDRVELAATGSAYVGKKLDLFLALQVGVGGTEHAPAYVDGARIELDYRPVARLALSGGFDYVGLTVPQPLVSAFYAGHSRHSDLSAFYDFGPFRLGAIGGTALDVTSALSRSWIGGEVQAPRFFTPRVSASLGYQEEFGWLSGRSAFLQVVARPANPLRLIARITWSHDGSLGIDQDELGGALSLVADLTQRIALRLSALYRAVVDTEAFGSSPTGLNANATLRALF